MAAVIWRQDNTSEMLSMGTVLNNRGGTIVPKTSRLRSFEAIDSAVSKPPLPRLRVSLVFGGVLCQLLEKQNCSLTQNAAVTGQGSKKLIFVQPERVSLVPKTSQKEPVRWDEKVDPRS